MKTSTMPTGWDVIPRCAGSSAARPSCAMPHRPARWDGSRRNGSRVTRISLRSSICPGSGSIPFRDYVDSRGLTSYAPDLGELAQRLAVDVHQILNGAKPGDIPIYRPNKFQLLVNLKAAKA